MTGTSHSQSQVQLFRFHHLILTMYPSAILPAEFSTRLLRLSLHKLAPLLEPSPLPAAAKLTNGGGKRGKKRVRGAEDGLVGGLEGREGRAVSSDEIEVILESLECSLLPMCHF